MNSPEVFYLHIQGEQRGPYTIKHIDHLLNSGLISEDALFWREGLEQWQPVTRLVTLRQPKNHWKLPLLALVSASILAVFLYLFGPITIDGWREIYQHEYTTEAAYWRAREVVRNNCVGKGEVVSFEPFTESDVALTGADEATVRLHGSIGDTSLRSVVWRVRLHYSAKAREWTGIEAVEQTQP